MLSADQLFQRLLKELRPALAERGFRQRSQNFITESADCWGVVNFQKSLYSTSGQKDFTVNLAIAAKRILDFYGEPVNKAPRHYASHWEIRIGDLIPGNLDRWWTLSGERSYELVAPEVEKSIFTLAVPIIRNHLSEDGLLLLWDSPNPGYYEYPRLKYRSIILAERGELEKLPPIFERIQEICQGGAAQAGAGEHIASLKRRYVQIQ